MCALAEGLSALITFKWVLTCVGGLMLGEGGAAAEGFPTFATFIGFCSRVGSLMANKLSALAKGFPTLATLKRLRPGVNPLMLI